MKLLTWLYEARNNAYFRRQIRRRGDRDLAARISAHQFINRFLRTYSPSGNSFPSTQPSLPEDPAVTQKAGFRAWIYWAQGFANAPPVVAASLNRLRKMNPDAMVIELDDKNIGNYVHIPSCVQEKLSDDKTHFSDVLRCALLARHGGVWLDATCFCAKPLQPLIESTGRKFFAYTRDDTYLLSSWFMISAPSARIPVLLRDALFCYWSMSEKLENYFWIHYIFEALYNQDAEFSAAWDCRFIQSSAAAHTLQEHLSQPFSADRFSEILDLTPIQKLTYKIPDPPCGSYWHHVCQDT